MLSHLPKNFNKSATPQLLRHLTTLLPSPNSVLVTTKNKFVTTVDIDEGKFSFSVGLPAKPYQGLDNGPKPIDILLSSYASCTSMMGKFIATKNGYPLKEIKCKMSHKKEGETDVFVREVQFVGDTLTDEMKKTLLGGINSCPIHHLLHNSKKKTITKLID
ncbi:osmc family protein [Anaeramoeba flamelloides]|uniref:Osmc family protein n=1 Tax=Anaeramoeba flamelloides TaxID=1746091 RepID=A0ABQ8ZBS8_9EUKA|nr:osmc family protein [Anaeramoeba flamelloides]